MTITTNPPIIDGHNDTLLSLVSDERGQGRSFFDESDIGHIDLPRARKGGLSGGFFAMFVPSQHYEFAENITTTDDGYAVKMAPPVDAQHAQAFIAKLIAKLVEIEQVSDGAVQVVRSVPELRAALEQDKLAVIMHIEGAEAISPDLSNLGDYYEQGLRSLGIVWSRANAFAEGVPFRFPHSPDTGPGLTNAGKALVKACNDMGILIDLSHLNEKGFWDVECLTTAPLAVTHTGVHAICASTRNLTDKQIDAVGASGGIIGINFSVGMSRPDGKNEKDTPLTVLADHLDYIVKRIGIDHVALGSDFDGTSISNEMRDVAGLPKLLDVIRARGYSDAELAKITYQNWLRVLDATWKN